jgi:putative endonuclease
MYYVYILKSLKDLKLYIGRSDDLKRRFDEHTKGRVQATKHRRPLKLIFYEAYSDKKDATRREKYFKTTKGKTTLRIMLTESLK